METIKAINTKLVAMTANANKIKDVRSTLVNDIIALVINEAKNEHVNFANKRLAQKWIIIQLLNDEKLEQDTFTKRALALAKKVLVDGYVIKKELLALSVAESLCNASKGNVNALLELDDDDYCESVKTLIVITKKQTAHKKVVDMKLLDKMEQLQALKLTPAQLALIIRAL